MSDNGQAPSLLPSFNFANVSYKWTKDWARTFNEVVRAQVLIEAEAKDDATPEERASVNRAKLEAVASIGDFLDKRDALVAQVLTFVPREWLVAEAPEDLDWSKPESLEYLRMDKVQALQDALNEAVRTPAGN
jgi:hypothetical protein